MIALAAMVAAGAALAVASLAYLVANDARARSQRTADAALRHLAEHRHASEYRIPTNGKHDHGQ